MRGRLDDDSVSGRSPLRMASKGDSTGKMKGGKDGLSSRVNWTLIFTFPGLEKPAGARGVGGGGWRQRSKFALWLPQILPSAVYINLCC